MEERHKYKCSKCRKLFPQKAIELQEFKKWNEWQRELDRETLRLELAKTMACKEGRKIFRAFRLLFREKKRQLAKVARERRPFGQLWRLNRRFSTIDHRELTKWHVRDKKELYAYFKEWRTSHLYEARLKQRLAHWRTKQKALTLHYLKNDENRAYTNEIFSSPPTLLPYHLL